MDPAELERLVDEEKIDELFAIVSLEDMADARWRYTLAERRHG
jgi:hypothetical protein